MRIARAQALVQGAAFTFLLSACSGDAVYDGVAAGQASSSGRSGMSTLPSGGNAAGTGAVGNAGSETGGTSAGVGGAGSSTAGGLGGMAAGSAGGGASFGGNGGAAGVASEGGSAGGEPAPWPCPRLAPCVILPLGDSITFGYGSTTGGGYRVPLLSHALADKKSITFVGSVSSGPDQLSGQPFPKGNEGHSGYSIDDSSATKGISPLVDHALATYEPNIVLLMIGTNDMHYKLDLSNAPVRLGKLIDRITTDAPNALLVVAKIIPANGAQNTPTQAYNAGIPSVVQARSAAGRHVVLVDMYAALDHWSSTLYKDSEHPNDAGYGAMADTWYAAIHTLLP